MENSLTNKTVAPPLRYRSAGEELLVTFRKGSGGPLYSTAHARKDIKMRLYQKALATLLLVLPVASVSAQAPAPNPGRVCLNIRDVQRTETPDDRTILFHMRNGKIWRNTLKQVCPMLTTSPYTQVLRNGDLVCANQQFIEVNLTGNTCMLGEFTPAGERR